MGFVTDRATLFSGRLGTQSVSVWISWHGSDLVVCSQDIGPALEALYGEDEIETFLTVSAGHLPRLARGLGCTPEPDAIQAALMDRYRGDSAATTHFKAFLGASGIPYDFHMT